jgi:hypothetical protein
MPYTRAVTDLLPCPPACHACLASMQGPAQQQEQEQLQQQQQEQQQQERTERLQRQQGFVSHLDQAGLEARFCTYMAARAPLADDQALPVEAVDDLLTAADIIRGTSKASSTAVLVRSWVLFQVKCHWASMPTTFVSWATGLCVTGLGSAEEVEKGVRVGFILHTMWQRVARCNTVQGEPTAAVAAASARHSIVAGQTRPCGCAALTKPGVLAGLACRIRPAASEAHTGRPSARPNNSNPPRCCRCVVRRVQPSWPAPAPRGPWSSSCHTT